jgi:hypothetical protein
VLKLEHVLIVHNFGTPSSELLLNKHPNSHTSGSNDVNWDSTLEAILLNIQSLELTPTRDSLEMTMLQFAYLQLSLKNCQFNIMGFRTVIINGSIQSVEL